MGVQTMRCGILIIGSLLWDSKTARRAEWRESRLDVGARVPVWVPIQYGRKSSTRGNSYTMTFRTGESSGRAVLAPCNCNIKTINDLIAEANALWQAEAPQAKSPAIDSNWGCVGAMFRSDAANQELIAGWTAHFQKNAQSVSGVNANGLLDIGWPNTLEDRRVDFDVILATANEPETNPPTVDAIADAWVNQCGSEDYFFNNVQHDIRTPCDREIWHRIEKKSPCWLEKKEPEYRQAIEILCSEVANSGQS